ncbi:MAG: sigma 54-interacting transcriptional regulator [Deltaproteobacteria bacterium]|nr:sigma 54-interacting transcriptional regulator [Deltaproteobacteria bacterium]
MTTESLDAQSIPRNLRVRVASGPDTGLGRLVSELIVAGTSEVCELKLTDRSVSRRHCTLEPAGASVRIRDAGSRNGVWFGAARIEVADLPPGSQIVLGHSTLTFELGTPAEAQQPVVVPMTSFGRFLGSSPSLAPMYRVLNIALEQPGLTVLLEGESGTGKELLAEALHEKSKRADGPFVVVDCAAIPETLIESELFGTEMGAFTGAGARKGAFEQAHHGTIFLDEIGELPLALQTRLLGVLERRQFKRVGGTKAIQVDVRVVAATNRNLEREVEEGRFRLDLFHRLAVALVHIPPLSRRREDIETLALHFARAIPQKSELGVLSPEVLGRLCEKEWPGNVRELRNHIERLVLFGESNAMMGSKTSEPEGEDARLTAIVGAARSGVSFRAARATALAAFTELYVEDMLARHSGNVSRAAEAAGVARRHFHRLKELGRND